MHEQSPLRVKAGEIRQSRRDSGRDFTEHPPFVVNKHARHVSELALIF